MNKLRKAKSIYNPSSCKLEKASRQECRECRGVGMTKDGGCEVCKGYGELWVTTGGWGLPLYSREVNGGGAFV